MHRSPWSFKAVATCFFIRTPAAAVVLVGVLVCGQAHGRDPAPCAHRTQLQPVPAGAHRAQQPASRWRRVLRHVPGAQRAGSAVRSTQRRLWQWRRPALRTLVLDFDGTMTDVTAEARGFLAAHERLFQQRTGLSDARLRTVLDEARRRVGADVAAGWQRDTEPADPAAPAQPAAQRRSVVVAPATADPYVMASAVTREAIAIAIARGWLPPGTLPKSAGSAADPEPLLDELFRAAYGKSGVAFRPGAARFLDRALRRYRVVIVTNSDTAGVQKKLDRLAADTGMAHLRDIPVYGNARKFAPTPDYGAVPDTLQIPGLPRPVYLRRGRYGKLLLEQLKLDPKRSAVVGDIPELDLYLPLELGFRRAILIKNNYSRELDESYLQRHERGAVTDDFTGVLRALEQSAQPTHRRRR